MANLINAPCRETARNAVARHLGHTTGHAEQLVSELTDAEVAGIIAAAADRYTARDGIKQIFAQAYDRRRGAAALEAEQRTQRLRRSGLARKVMERLGATVAESLDAVERLTDEEIAGLAALENNPDAEEAARAILGPAAARIYGQDAPLPTHSPDGIPDLDPGTVSPAAAAVAPAATEPVSIAPATVAEAATNVPPAAALDPQPAAEEATELAAEPPVNEQGLEADDVKAIDRLSDNGGPHHPPEPEPAPQAEPAPPPAKKSKKKG